MSFVATPWSAPSWMKTKNSLIAESESNTLIDSDQVYQSYAQYFLKIVEAFADRKLNISYITLQNEPLFGTSVEYPGMYFDAKQAARLGKLVRDTLPSYVGILAYDHNWDHPEYPASVISAEPSCVTGVAWHCYGGDMAVALDKMQLLYPYPSYPQHITECTGGFPNSVRDITQGLSGFGYNHEWDMNNIFLGASSHYAVSGVKWIIALDENCGPVLPLVSWRSGRPVVSIPTNASSMSDIRFNQDFWSISHMSRFVLPGSIRIRSQVIGTHTSSLLVTESFLFPTTQQISMIAMNTDKQNPVSVIIKQGSILFSHSIPPFSTVVFQWTNHTTTTTTTQY